MQPVLTRPIGWALTVQQYDQMVRYATALRLGTAAAADILRRFTRATLHTPRIGRSRNWAKLSGRPSSVAA